MAFSEFPKCMTHPGYKPAVISRDEVVNGKIVKAAPGSPVHFPPVYVNNPDQEADYASRGYVPNGTSDPEAYFSQLVKVHTPNPGEFQEFPKWLYAPTVPGEYKHEIVQNQEAQDALDGAWYATPGDAIAASYETDASDDEETVSDDSGEQKAGKKRR